VSVRVNEVIGVAGYVLPGNRVDILATASPTDAHADTTTKVILSNVQVVTAGTRMEQDQEKGKPFTRKVYERLVGGVAKLLENPSREEVATKSDVSGRIDNPRVSVMEVVLRLVQNAFFKAILPGFDLESGRAERVRRTASR
jgi:hypothetical protein